MLNHVSLGTNDLEKALTFYDATLGALGYKRTFTLEGMGSSYGVADGRHDTQSPGFWIQITREDETASVGTGTHICFNATSRDAVQAFHDTGIATGGTSDGKPGLRPEYAPNYYAAFLRDPDGHKIEAVFFE